MSADGGEERVDKARRSYLVSDRAHSYTDRHAPMLPANVRSHRRAPAADDNRGTAFARASGCAALLGRFAD